MTTLTPAIPAAPDRSVLTYFAAFILLVGGAPVAMRIGYAELQPFWLGLARFGLGAAAFWGLALYKRMQVPKGRALVGAILYGTLGVGISFVLLAWGLVKTSASMAALLMAMVPLMTVLLSFTQGVEAFTDARPAGSTACSRWDRGRSRRRLSSGMFPWCTLGRYFLEPCFWPRAAWSSSAFRPTPRS